MTVCMYRYIHTTPLCYWPNMTGMPHVKKTGGPPSYQNRNGEPHFRVCEVCVICLAARSKTWVSAARLLVLRVRIPPGEWMCVLWLSKCHGDWWYTRLGVDEIGLLIPFWRSCVVRWGHAVAQLVEALRYKPEGRGLDFRWCLWYFSLT